MYNKTVYALGVNRSCIRELLSLTLPTTHPVRYILPKPLLPWLLCCSVKVRNLDTPFTLSPMSLTGN